MHELSRDVSHSFLLSWTSVAPGKPLTGGSGEVATVPKWLGVAPAGHVENADVASAAESLLLLR